MAPYLTGTSFSNERTVRQIPREIASGERGRGHRVTARSLARISYRTRHSDAASHSRVSGTAPVRFHSMVKVASGPLTPLTFRTMTISDMDGLKTACGRSFTFKSYIFLIGKNLYRVSRVITLHKVVHVRLYPEKKVNN